MKLLIDLSPVQRRGDSSPEERAGINIKRDRFRLIFAGAAFFLQIERRDSLC